MIKKEEKTVLIIGLGGIGFRFDQFLPIKSYVLSHARAFSSHPNFKIIGGVDPLLKNRNDFSKLYSCETFSNVIDALKKVTPDVIVVASPTESHLQVIIDIFSNSSPNIIVCEKPLAYSVDDAEKILSLCKKNSTSIYVNYMRNSSSVIEDISLKIQNKIIEHPFKVINLYSKGLLNSGSHFIALFNHLFGKPLNVELLNSSRNKKIGNDFDLDFKIEYLDGEVFFHSLNYLNYFHNSFDIFAKNGLLSYERGGEYVKWSSLSKNGIYSNYKILDKTCENLKSNFKIIQLEFVENLWKKINKFPSNICSGSEALNVMKCINNIISLQNEKK